MDMNWPQRGKFFFSSRKIERQSSSISYSSRRTTSVCCGRKIPKKAKALIATIIPFGLITVLQFFAAIMANSTALLVDCGSMLVDVLTYVGNLWTLCHEEVSENESVKNSLISSGISLFVLYGITLWGVVDSVSDLMQKSQPDKLNPDIVLLFGIGGLLFDAIALIAFRTWGLELPALDRSVIELVDAGEFTIFDTEKEEIPPDNGLAHEASLVNMFSALSHVIADTVRSLSSIALGTIVMADKKLNGSTCDDFATLVVATTIVLGSISLVLDWLQIFRKYNFPTIQEPHSPRVGDTVRCDKRRDDSSPVKNPFSTIFNCNTTNAEHFFSPRISQNRLSTGDIEMIDQQYADQRRHRLAHFSSPVRTISSATTSSPEIKATDTYLDYDEDENARARRHSYFSSPDKSTKDEERSFIL